MGLVFQFPLKVMGRMHTAYVIKLAASQVEILELLMETTTHSWPIQLSVVPEHFQRFWNVEN